MGENKLIYIKEEVKPMGDTAVLNLLTTYKNTITEHLNNSKSHLLTGELNTKDDLLQGDYYDIYIEKRNAWMQEITQIQAKYDAVLANIDSCIADINHKAASWNLKKKG